MYKVLLCLAMVFSLQLTINSPVDKHLKSLHSTNSKNVAEENNKSKFITEIGQYGVATSMAGSLLKNECEEIVILSGSPDTLGEYFADITTKYNGRYLYRGPPGAYLVYEVPFSGSGFPGGDGANWAANNWMQGPSWTIIYGDHHRYALLSTSSSFQMQNESGWRMRMGATPPIEVQCIDNPLSPFP